MNANKFNALLRKLNTDKKAFELLYAEFYPKTVFHLRRCFGNVVPAEDIAQDLFLKLLQLQQKEPVRNPTAWIFALSENLAKDALQKIHFELPLSETLSDASPDTDKIIANAELKKFFSTLDKTSQKILYMHYWEGYTLKEIAENLGISYMVLRKQVSRVYKNLKKFFSEN